MTMTDTEKNIDRIIDEAAEWFVLIEAGDATDKDKARFAEWLNASPLHAREYAEVSGLWDEAALYGRELDPAPAVVQLYPDRKSAPETPKNPAPLWSEWRKLAAALVVGILVTTAAAYLLFPQQGTDIAITAPQSFQTAKGESRRFRLEDGSFVQLNTDSRIEVSFTDGFRELTLKQGEAFFEVAPNPLRPFIVAVDTTRVQVVGTQFNVNKRLEKIEVTVLEGKVRVSEQPPQQSEKWIADLTKGEQVVTRPLSLMNNTAMKSLIAKQDHLNLKAILSWRDNKLTFDNRDLRDVVEDFNRYNDLALVLADPSLNRIKVSGTFNPNDPESFAKSIERIAHIRSQATQDGRIVFYKELE
tara:strand:+ start:879 stop:1952 length:1074 start_codon:yes stop_codon:yes gene_type:complete